MIRFSLGLKETPWQRARSSPTVMMLPSGGVLCFLPDETLDGVSLQHDGQD